MKRLVPATSRLPLVMRHEQPAQTWHGALARLLLLYPLRRLRLEEGKAADGVVSWQHCCLQVWPAAARASATPLDLSWRPCLAYLQRSHVNSQPPGRRVTQQRGACERRALRWIGVASC